jgi:hypothetical protein
MTASAAAIAPIVSALTAPRLRPDETGPEAIMALILSMGASSPMQMMFAGQLVALHATFADASRDLLVGMVDAKKQKGQTMLISLARTIQGHADRLDRMREKAQADGVAAQTPTRTAATTARPVPPAAPPDDGTWNISPRMALEIMTAMARDSAQGAAPEEVVETRQDASPEPEAPPAATPESQGAEVEGYRRPEPPDTWLDEPVVQWLVETPADEAHRLGHLTPPAEAEPDASPAPAPADHKVAAGEPASSAEGEGFAARSSGYRPAARAESSPERPLPLVPPASPPDGFTGRALDGQPASHHAPVPG